VRRLLTWLAGAAGGLAAYRALARRRTTAAEPAVDRDSRAEELRETLARARESEEESPAESIGADDPDARRRAVHEQARTALDEMRRD
jgi:hypothetical protein